MRAVRKQFDYIPYKIEKVEKESWFSKQVYSEYTKVEIPFHKFTQEVEKFVSSLPMEHVISISENIYESACSYKERSIVVWYWSNT